MADHVENLAAAISALPMVDRLRLWQLLREDDQPPDKLGVREPVKPKPSAGGAQATSGG